MSDQTDSGHDEKDTPAPQAGNGSQTSGDSETQQGNSLAGADLAAAAQNDPEAFDILRRQLQSEKDRGVSKANKQSQEAKSEVEAIANILGISDEDLQKARRTRALDRLVQEEGLGGSQVTSSDGVTLDNQQAASSQEVDYQKVIETVGLDPNSNAVIQAAIKHAGNPDAFKVALVDLKQNQTSPPVTTTGTVQPSGIQRTPSAVDTAGLVEEYDQLRREPLGKKLPSGQTVLERRSEIQAALEEANNKQ
jgi:hypothetical protein